MNDFPFVSDKAPIIGWERIQPSKSDPLIQLRGKMVDAWEKYYNACDRYQDGECKFEHVEFTRSQAEAVEADYHRKYKAAQEVIARQLAQDGMCNCSTPDQTCDVCRKHSNSDEDPLPY